MVDLFNVFAIFCKITELIFPSVLKNSKLARLSRNKELSKKETLEKERAVAVATAVDALAKLHHRDTI